MKQRVAAAIGILAVGALAVSTASLWRDNRRLRRALAAGGSGGAADRESAGSNDVSVRRGAADPLAFVGALGRVVTAAAAQGEKPTADAGPTNGDQDRETVEQRRDRRQQLLRDLLGRRPGESDADYKSRITPLVTAALSGPRDRVAEKRRQFEEAAGVTAEQRAQLDAAFHDGQAELVHLADVAIADGDLTPYERNTRGVLAFIGSTVGTVDALDAALGKILTPEQRALMGEAGFDWVEYLGVTAPWEDTHPPPPPGGKAGL